MFSWKKPGKTVAVVGPFSNFQPLVLNTGLIDTEKTAVVSVPAGRTYYRFVVDGAEQYDPDKPNELFECTPSSPIVAKLFNYVDVADPGTEQKKELMEMSNEDLEFLVSKLNGGRDSFSENVESKLIQTPKSQYSIMAEPKSDRKKDYPVQEETKNVAVEMTGDNLESMISKLDDKTVDSRATGIQTDLSAEDITKWQK